MPDAKKVTEMLIKKSPTVFIASVDAEGFPNLKAMSPPRKIVGITTYYFITTTSSLRVAQFRDNRKASIYFCDPRHFVGVMLKGTTVFLSLPPAAVAFIETSAQQTSEFSFLRENHPEGDCSTSRVDVIH